MTITNFASTSFAIQSFGMSGLKTAIVEPVLLSGAALFWVAALPFIALSLMGVKIWDTLVALVSGSAGRPNPLIIRRGIAKSPLTGKDSARVARV